MKRGKWFGIIVAFVLVASLVVSLVAGACAPAAPAEEAAPEKAEVVELLLQSGTSAGNKYEATVQFKKNIEEASGGRIQAEVVMPEAIVPTKECYAGLRDGVIEMLCTWNPWYRGQIPFLEIVLYTQVLLRSPADVWAMFKYEGWGELMSQELGKWNIYWVESVGHAPGNVLVSKVSLPTIDDIKGVKFRIAGSSALVFDELGAHTVWFPMDEIYTGLASGLIDGASADNPASMYGMGLAEVTKYWILPYLYRVDETGITANMDFWNTLSEADQALMHSCALSALADTGWDSTYECDVAMAKAREEGIIIQYWDEESQAKYVEAAMKVLPEPKDEASILAKEQLYNYMRNMGYID